jgi:hypothetical protein
MIFVWIGIAALAGLTLLTSSLSAIARGNWDSPAVQVFTFLTKPLVAVSVIEQDIASIPPRQVFFEILAYFALLGAIAFLLFGGAAKGRSR